MLNILLTIIAIGTLLASRAGQKLLAFLIGFAIVLGGLFLVIILIGGSITFLTDNKDIIYNTYQKYGIILPVFILGYGLYSIYKKCQREGLAQGLTEIIEKAFPDFKNDLKENKGAINFLIIAFSFIIIIAIYIFFN